jgi:beta-glucosidase/6-phospho-beta-glucosidase/beta-galactosidase
MDNLEWAEGTAKRFGLAGVDFAGGSLERRMKASGKWYAKVCRENAITR